MPDGRASVCDAPTRAHDGTRPEIHEVYIGPGRLCGPFRQEGRDGGEREIVRGVAALRFSVFQDSTNSVIHVV